MSEKLLAALKVGPATTELREFDLPDVPPDAALMRMEVAGVCGTDVGQYSCRCAALRSSWGTRTSGPLPGSSASLPSTRDSRTAISCSSSITCHAATASGITWVSTVIVRRRNGSTIRRRSGTGTSLDIAPGLWGGFSHYVYLPLNAVLHKVPRGLSPEEAGLATPMSNGIQWTLFDGGLVRTVTVLIQGPGQQGCAA